MSAAYRVTVCCGTATAARPCSAVLPEHARRLAAQVRAEWLAVTFDGGHDQAAVCQVETWPDLADPRTREALVHALMIPGWIVILLWGLRHEAPMAYVLRALTRRGVETVMIDQRAYPTIDRLPDACQDGAAGGYPSRDTGDRLRGSAGFLRPYPIPPVITTV